MGFNFQPGRAGQHTGLCKPIKLEPIAPEINIKFQFYTLKCFLGFMLKGGQGKLIKFHFKIPHVDARTKEKKQPASLVGPEGVSGEALANLLVREPFATGSGVQRALHRGALSPAFAPHPQTAACDCIRASLGLHMSTLCGLKTAVAGMDTMESNRGCKRPTRAAIQPGVLADWVLVAKACSLTTKAG
eukprot:1161942-Pelagomonas_calceolata.AAC.3